MEKIQDYHEDTSPFNDPQRASASKQIKKDARKDKAAHVLNALIEDVNAPPHQKWNTIKNIRKGFTPKPTALKDPNGNLRPPEQRAELLADHYQSKLWTTPPP